ncbi:MAG: hypothetical protein AAFP84_20780 [Actinomycetota bacterium]
MFSAQAAPKLERSRRDGWLIVESVEREASAPATLRHERSVSIIDAIPGHARPFADAVSMQRHESAVRRALAVWEQFVTVALEVVTTTWSHGTSIDPLDGDIELVTSPGRAVVELRTEAMVTTPDPMHLRGAVHLIEKLRPAMRREAAISIGTLDAITATELRDAVLRYPMVLARPGDAAALERLRRRYDAKPSTLRRVG